MLCMWIIAEAKKHVPSALERLWAKITTLPSFWLSLYLLLRSEFKLYKMFKYKNTELRNSTNKTCFQNHMCTCFLKKIILLDTFICDGNKWSYILKQSCSLELKLYLRGMYDLMNHLPSKIIVLNCKSL